jgi:cell wall-associated NlpC family hydrolase
VQSVTVASTVAAAKTVHDGFSSQTQAQLLAAAAQAAAASLASYRAAYSGPSYAQALANPPQPNFSLSAVFATAQRYRGVPYVYGGDTPAGFDCSGFVRWVYGQFGISLPHSVSAQGWIGTRISAADARPGDVIVLSDGSHDGFYAGPGMILDAPEPGKVVQIRPIWTSSYYVVRFGIKH